MIFKSRNKLNIIMINESLILVRFTFATNSHFIDIIADKFLTRYYIGLKYIVTDVRRAPFLVQKSLLVQKKFVSHSSMDPTYTVSYGIIRSVWPYISTFYIMRLGRVLKRMFWAKFLIWWLALLKQKCSIRSSPKKSDIQNDFRFNLEYTSLHALLIQFIISLSHCFN